MELINNTVWIISGNDCFAVFSSKAYVEEYKKSAIEAWEKSIIRDTIPRRLNNRAEIETHAKNYPEVIQISNDHYELVRGWSSSDSNQFWQYQLMSNVNWDEYYQKFVSNYIIKDHIVLK